MFDLTSSKLLLLAIVALLVLGPKDFLVLMRTIGKYLAIIKRQADEFREHFKEAMRESELEELKKQVETIGRETEQSLRATEQSIKADFDKVSEEFDRAAARINGPGESEPRKPDPYAHDANGIPFAETAERAVQVDAASPLPPPQAAVAQGSAKPDAADVALSHARASAEAPARP